MEKFKSGDSKIKFFISGIRYKDILILIVYPTIGAILSAESFSLDFFLKIIQFSIFNFLFLTHLFTINDIYDTLLFPEEPELRKYHALKIKSISINAVKYFSFFCLIISLTGFFFLSPSVFLLLIVIEVLIYLYSHPTVNLKGIPVVSTAIHFVGAFLYFTAGWLLFSPVELIGILTALYFSIVLSAGHYSNEISDWSNDRAAGINTNVIAFGRRRMFRFGIFLFLLSSVLFLFIAKYLYNDFYLILTGVIIISLWIIVAAYYRNWQSGDPIEFFRKLYRVIYASFCAVIIAIKILTIK